MVDRGSNGGVTGSEVRFIDKSDRFVDVTGIGNHQITGLPIVTSGGFTKSHNGYIIVMLNQYAYSPMGNTIHSRI